MKNNNNNNLAVKMEPVPLLLLLLELLRRHVVELLRQLEALSVIRWSESLGLPVQLSSDWFSSLKTISLLLHQLQGISTILG